MHEYVDSPPSEFINGGHCTPVRLCAPFRSGTVTRGRDSMADIGRDHCRVLIIEDDPDSSDSLREALELDGHEIAVALNASEGLSKARDLHPDVVVCDIGLPDSDGYTVAQTLRAEKSLENACLVAISGYGRPDDMKRASQAGFTHHFTKPISLEAVQLLLRELSPRGSASP